MKSSKNVDFFELLYRQKLPRNTQVLITAGSRADNLTIYDAFRYASGVKWEILSNDLIADSSLLNASFLVYKQSVTILNQRECAFVKSYTEAMDKAGVAHTKTLIFSAASYAYYIKTTVPTWFAPAKKSAAKRPTVKLPTKVARYNIKYVKANGLVKSYEFAPISVNRDLITGYVEGSGVRSFKKSNILSLSVV